jgi:hypothetical protein
VALQVQPDVVLPAQAFHSNRIQALDDDNEVNVLEILGTTFGDFIRHYYIYFCFSQQIKVAYFQVVSNFRTITF